MQESCLVSIVMPLRNAGAYVAQSISAILHEKSVPLELIIVDDQSTDDSVKRIKEFGDPRIRLISGPDRGIAACLNVGLSEVQGEIVMRCDGDDIYPPNRISEQIKILADFPEYEALCGSFSMIDPRGKLITPLQTGNKFEEISDELKHGKLRTHLCTYGIRTAVLKKVGPFREFFESAEDIDFQLRLGETARVAYSPRLWYLYRIHGNSITHTQSTELRKFFEQTALALQAQRRSEGQDDLERGLRPVRPINSERSSPTSAASHTQNMLLGRAWEEMRSGRKIGALQLAFRAFIARPTDLSTLRSLVILVLKCFNNL